MRANAFPLSRETRQAIGRANIARRYEPREVAIERERDADASRLADHIKAVVAAAPPLTSEQRDRLAALLRGGGDRASH